VLDLGISITPETNLLYLSFLGFFLAEDLGVVAAFFAYESGVFLAKFGSLEVDLLVD
jgi:hypothetical protein